MLVPLSCPILLFRQQHPPWLHGTEPERSWHSPRPMCWGCGTAGGPRGCQGQGTGGQRGWGLSRCPVTGGNGRGSANPTKWHLCLLPEKRAAVAGQERGRGQLPGQADPGRPWEHHPQDGCWAASEKTRLKPRGRSWGSPRLSPSRRGTSPRGPPIAACTGCFFCLRAADAGSASSCLSGARVAFEEL